MSFMHSSLIASLNGGNIEEAYVNLTLVDVYDDEVFMQIISINLK